MADTWVVVGLGNPGRRYAATRHNIGWRLVDRLARALRAEPEREEEGCRVAWASWGGRRIALLKPTTYMNRSGDALARFRAGPAVDPGRHLVVLDDVALPFGAIRFRAGGSAGGHRGLQSVIDRLGTSDVPRLRLGVGGAPEGMDLADHVLARFTADEEAALEPWLERAVEGVRTFIVEGPEAAMNRFNR